MRVEFRRGLVYLAEEMVEFFVLEGRAGEPADDVQDGEKFGWVRRHHVSKGGVPVLAQEGEELDRGNLIARLF